MFSSKRLLLSLSVIFILSLIAIPLEAFSQKTPDERRLEDQRREVLSKQSFVWPLEFITAQTKLSRLKIIFPLNSLSVAPYSKANKENCEQYLNKLTSFHFKILEPKMFSAANTGYTPRWEGKPWPEIIFKYFVSYKNPTLQNDKDFVGLTAEEKEKKADLILIPTENEEYYDFSVYFGDGIHGYLGEGVKRLCTEKTKNMCETPNWDGFVNFAGYLGAVFNTHTKEIFYLPELFAVNRARGKQLYDHRTSLSNYIADVYEETPSFAAFVDIDQKPFALGFRTVSWDTALQRGGVTEMMLTPATPGAHTAQDTCYYNSKKMSINE